MKMITGRFLFLAIGVITGLAGMNSCSKEQEVLNLVAPPNCDSTEISYQRDIVSIMNSTCAFSPCHVPGNGNYDFTSYEVLADRIRSGRLEERLLISVDSPLHMPQDASNIGKGIPMDACNLYKLRLWIHQGFKNN